MTKETKNKLSVIFNGDTKWVLTLFATIAVAIAAYGRQLQAIDDLTKEMNKKADITVVENKVAILDTKISSVSNDVSDIKKDIDTIRSDIKILLQRSKR